MAFRMYPNFPDLNLQLSDARSKFTAAPSWNLNVTYSDEYRRGFDCREDLLVPGFFETNLKPGGSVIFSGSVMQENPAEFKRRFASEVREAGEISLYRDQLRRCAEQKRFGV